jgi:hypothetical protein
MKNILFTVLTVLALGCVSAWPADHCVRQGSAGNGSDWTNAYGQLPATLVRGDTYYIADGSYGSYVFNTPVSGSLYVYIKKATETAHGTNTGWLNTYGDSTAGFLQLTLNTGYFDIDGVTGGGPGSWKTGHGFALTQDAGTDRTFIEIAADVSAIRIRRIKFMEVGNTELGRYGAQGIHNASTVYNLLVERCYFDNLNGLPFFFRGGSGVVIQYN